MGALRVGIVPGAEMSWVGMEVGIRKPEPWETPLSPAEVKFAIDKGLVGEPEAQPVSPWVLSYLNSRSADANRQVCV